MSIPRERTFTSLIAPAPGRTDTGLRRYDDTCPTPAGVVRFERTGGGLVTFCFPPSIISYQL